MNVLENAQISWVTYTSEANFELVINNGVATLTCVGNDYLKSITITY